MGNVVAGGIVAGGIVVTGGIVAEGSAAATAGSGSDIVLVGCTTSVTTGTKDTTGFSGTTVPLVPVPVTTTRNTMVLLQQSLLWVVLVQLW